MKKHGGKILVFILVIALLLVASPAIADKGGGGKPDKCDNPPCSNPDGGGKDKPDANPGQGDQHDGNNGQGNDPDCQDDSNGQGVPGHCTTKPPEEPCGDGTVQQPEKCDDGNNIDGDGCSASCELEDIPPPPPPPPPPSSGEQTADQCCCQAHLGMSINLPDFDYGVVYAITINNMVWNVSVLKGTAYENSLEITEECFCAPNIVLNPEVGETLTLVIEDWDGNLYISELLVNIKE